MTLHHIALLGGILLIISTHAMGGADAIKPTTTPPSKTSGALYPGRLIELAVQNAASDAEMQASRDQIVARAKPWLETPDDELWSWVFASTIKRSWMVYSSGADPETGEPVLMYEWGIDPFAHPWKVRSPRTGKLYPTNDFEAYHRSGLDERGLFDPSRANRSLLYNTEHPDPSDPLHQFGVDNGDGFARGDDRWRFIGTYLIYGQWKARILEGIVRLSEAHMVTGDPAYARKAGILLDRLADVYPDYDFAEQGIVYEGPGLRGTISTWHDACVEVLQLAIAYDQIFESIKDDEELVAFLSRKAADHHLDNAKQSFADIQRNIEERLFRETLLHPDRILSNFPMTPITLVTVETVLDWPANRDRVIELLSDILRDSIKVDGLTGERGLQGYSTLFPRHLATLLARFDRLDPSILEELFILFPDLHKTWRFHIDTKIHGLYYLSEGDSGLFGRRHISQRASTDTVSRPAPFYLGMDLDLSATAGVEPCLFLFLWRLYEVTKDVDFVRVMFQANGDTFDGLPREIFAMDAAGFRERARQTLEDSGYALDLGDTRLDEWGLSILRSGQDANSVAVSLIHHVGGGHAHQDGLSIELFHGGLNLLPDYGYPPVGYLSGESPEKVSWFQRTSGHNTVVVDGKSHSNADGKTTLWASGDNIHAIRVESPGLYKIDRYERLILLIEQRSDRAYILDIFNVQGGTEHIRSYTSFFATVTPAHLTLEPYSFEHDWLIRNVQRDASPPGGWSLDWAFEDRYDYLNGAMTPHLRYHGISDGVEVLLADNWIDVGLYGGEPDWTSRLIERRRSKTGPLTSQFAGILEPYMDTPFIRDVQPVRLVHEDGGESIAGSFSRGWSVDFMDGTRHLIGIIDPEILPAEWSFESQRDFSFNGEVAVISLGTNSQPTSMELINGQAIRWKDARFEYDEERALVEIVVEEDKAREVTQK